MKRLMFLSLCVVMPMHATDDDELGRLLMDQYNNVTWSLDQEIDAFSRWGDTKREKPCECDAGDTVCCLIGVWCLLAPCRGGCP